MKSRNHIPLYNLFTLGYTDIYDLSSSENSRIITYIKKGYGVLLNFIAPLPPLRTTHFALRIISTILPSPYTLLCPIFLLWRPLGLGR